MRLGALLFTLILTAAPAWAAQARPPSTPESSSPQKDASAPRDLHLPVSLDKIREALQRPALSLSLRTLDEGTTFRVEILERRRIEELLASLNFKTAPAPGGGLYGYEQQRQMFPAVDNPLRQPYAAFNQPELLTILIENLVGRYFAGRAINAISKAERARAGAAARDEVHAAVAHYCNAQPHAGVGIQICDTAPK